MTILTRIAIEAVVELTINRLHATERHHDLLCRSQSPAAACWRCSRSHLQRVSEIQKPDLLLAPSATLRILDHELGYREVRVTTSPQVTFVAATDTNVGRNEYYNSKAGLAEAKENE